MILLVEDVVAVFVLDVACDAMLAITLVTTAAVTTVAAGVGVGVAFNLSKCAVVFAPQTICRA